jgi:hypothetical protein
VIVSAPVSSLAVRDAQDTVICELDAVTSTGVFIRVGAVLIEAPAVLALE